ncbi:Sporulation-specific N-acetylmuramoyl-L-alanine amidase [compost metagenome]
MDLYISIHLNAFNGQAYGTEVYTYNAVKRDRAVRVLNNIVGLGYTNRGIKDGSSLYVIRNTKMESMLIECCFIDNSGDMSKFNSDKMAKAIAEGIHGNSIIVEDPKPVIQPIDSNVFYRVVTGSYKDRANAEAQVKALKDKGFDSFIDVYRK